MRNAPTGKASAIAAATSGARVMPSAGTMADGPKGESSLGSTPDSLTRSAMPLQAPHSKNADLELWVAHTSHQRIVLELLDHACLPSHPHSTVQGDACHSTCGFLRRGVEAHAIAPTTGHRDGQSRTHTLSLLCKTGPMSFQLDKNGVMLRTSAQTVE